MWNSIIIFNFLQSSGNVQIVSSKQNFTFTFISRNICSLITAKCDNEILMRNCRYQKCIMNILRLNFNTLLFFIIWFQCESYFIFFQHFPEQSSIRKIGNHSKKCVQKRLNKWWRLNKFYFITRHAEKMSFENFLFNPAVARSKSSSFFVQLFWFRFDWPLFVRRKKNYFQICVCVK